MNRMRANALRIHTPNEKQQRPRNKDELAEMVISDGDGGYDRDDGTYSREQVGFAAKVTHIKMSELIS